MIESMNPKKPRRLCENECGRRVAVPVAKFCSLRCSAESRVKTTSRLLEAGLYQGATNPYFLRKYLVKKYGERCCRCGWSEKHPTTGRIPVEVEHIDGDWRNNRPENLTLLCPNCHSLTPTFRALNKGRGRPMRRTARPPKDESRWKPARARSTAHVLEISGDLQMELALPTWLSG
jgi:hypothetical protein